MELRIGQIWKVINPDMKTTAIYQVISTQNYKDRPHMKRLGQHDKHIEDYYPWSTEVITENNGDETWTLLDLCETYNVKVGTLDIDN